MTPLLAIDNLTVAYGGIQAVKNVSLQVQVGELVCLIGSNGAGKSSTLKAICGLQPLSGSVNFAGVHVAGQGAWRLAQQGLVLVPEGRGIFTSMSIAENLQMGAFTRNDHAQIKRDMQDVYALFPKLSERSQQLAGSLSGGEQQMLALGRALMARPKLLLLDEPSMGLAPIMVEKIFQVIADIHQRGTSVLLVEQNAALALKLANRGYVIDCGEIILQGPAQELLSDPKVRQAYLGEVVQSYHRTELNH
jgi:branched-chain amino acid transport system ATP-binding protein